MESESDVGIARELHLILYASKHGRGRLILIVARNDKYLLFLDSVEVVRSVRRPQAQGSLLGSKVPLRLGHHLKPDEELADRGRAKKRRVEVEVQLGVGASRRGAGEMGRRRSSAG